MSPPPPAYPQADPQAEPPDQSPAQSPSQPAVTFSPASTSDTRRSPDRYLTDDLPAIGGRIKDRPEDFFVDEQPLYEPAGHGEHIYLFVEKRDLSTFAAAEVLASHFDVPRHAVGYAGLKDRHAVTRQVFSIHTPGKTIEDYPSLRHERMSVLWADYHINKLRRGHLAGNRFSIRIRGVGLAGVLTAREALGRLATLGVPNLFGEQRFGYLGRNHLVGRALLLGDDRAALDALLGPGPAATARSDHQHTARQAYAAGDFAAAAARFSPHSRAELRAIGALSRGATPSRAVESLHSDELGFYIAAFQSAVFNEILESRLASGTLGTLVEGDVAFKHDNRALFSVGPAELADPDTARRLRDFQISPSGPMWGPTMKRAAGDVGAADLAALARQGLTPDHLDIFARRNLCPFTGERRPFRVPLTFPEVEGGIDEHGSYIRVAFDLPRGAFATTVLREIMKPKRAGVSLAADDAAD